MHLARRTWWIVAAAVPTMVVALVAVYVLLRFMSVRDRLGDWHVALLNDYKHEIGHGRITLRAATWSWKWRWRSPFVTFSPVLDEQCGSFTIDPSVMAALDKQWMGHWSGNDLPVTRENVFYPETGEMALIVVMDPVTYVRMKVRLQDGVFDSGSGYAVECFCDDKPGSIGSWCTELHR